MLHRSLITGFCSICVLDGTRVLKFTAVVLLVPGILQCTRVQLLKLRVLSTVLDGVNLARKLPLLRKLGITVALRTRLGAFLPGKFTQNSLFGAI
jgi:hypothetical protein